MYIVTQSSLVKNDHLELFVTEVPMIMLMVAYLKLFLWWNETEDFYFLNLPWTLFSAKIPNEVMVKY